MVRNFGLMMSAIVKSKVLLRSSYSISSKKETGACTCFHGDGAPGSKYHS